MRKNELVNLYFIIKDLKATKLQPETRKTYTLLRIELVKLFKEYEQARQEISEQTKLDDQDKWNEAFQPIMVEWLNKESEIDSKIFSVDDYVDFISSNELKGDLEDLIGLLMIKK